MSKTYLVTGASRGIGLTLARRLRDRGDHVVTLSRTEPPQDGIPWFPCDMSDPEIIAETVRIHLQPYKFSGVILNAALADKSVDQSTPREMARHLAVNFMGPMTLWYFLEGGKLINDPCNVVLMSSFLQNGNARQPAYAASKAALWSWMRSYTMAQPLRHPVAMNMLWPGRVITPANPLRELPEGDANLFRMPQEILPAITNLLDLPVGGPRGTVVELGRS